MKRTEAGQGGRKGHSNMTHWSPTAIVKDDARRARRTNDVLAIDEGLADDMGDRP